MVHQPAKLSPESEKNLLEAEKIQEELKALRRPWWQKPAYIGAAVPAIIGIFSLLGIWLSGTLDLKFMDLKIQKNLLKMEEIDLTSRVQRLAEKEQKLEDQRAEIEQEIKFLKGQLETSVVEFHLSALANSSGKSPLFTWSDFKPLLAALSSNRNDASLKMFQSAMNLEAPWDEKLADLEPIDIKFWRAFLYKVISFVEDDRESYKELIKIAEDIYHSDASMRRRFIEAVEEDVPYEQKLEIFTVAIGFIIKNSDRYPEVSDFHQYDFWQQERRNAARNIKEYPQFLRNIEQCATRTDIEFIFDPEACFKTYMRLDFKESLVFFAGLDDDFSNLDRVWVLLKNEIEYIGRDCSDQSNRDVERCDIIEAGLPPSRSRSDWENWHDALK